MGREVDSHAHIPQYYVGGVYIRETDVWLGEFHATCEELMHYSENHARTIAEFELVTSMAIAQFEYETWWDRVRNEQRRRKQ